MKQLVQNLKTGNPLIIDVPPPICASGGIVVQNAASLISVGTERMLMDFGGKSLLGKAKERPDLVRQVLDKIKRDGLITTIQTVRGRLDDVMPIGYSSCGRVIESGKQVLEFREGDRVACAGGGYANHAEIVSLPKNLAVKLPDQVDFESAAFTTVGAIAMQGVRIAEVTLGETVAVIGLGLVGQIVVQLLQAAGCRVFGIDLSDERVDLARQFGADAGLAGSSQEVIQAADVFTQGNGFDAVIIAASTSENGPIELAGDIVRDRGRVVALGAVKMDVPRRNFYYKELDLRLSRSYGPGRYDPEYEEKGHDYPLGYVRWTMKRNMEAFVQLIASEKINLKALITHRFEIANAPDAYKLIAEGNQFYVGIVLSYKQDQDKPASPRIELAKPSSGDIRPNKKTMGLSLVGAGGFARATLLPALQKTSDVVLRGVSSAGGVNARSVGNRYKFHFCTSDNKDIWQDEETDAVLITTRHDLHAPLTLQALESGKDVFVEKPLALSERELISVLQAFLKTDRILMVGFNRRFAPIVQTIKKWLGQRSVPLAMNYRINAGFIPADHWVQDPEIGGGRIIGEVCHFIDLMSFLCDALPVEVFAQTMGVSGATPQDTVAMTVKFSDGSLGNISYFTNGDSSFSKEYLEVFCGDAVAVLDDFRFHKMVRGGRQKQKKHVRQNKGHQEELIAFRNAVIQRKSLPIPLEHLVAVSMATYRLLDSLRDGEPKSVPHIDDLGMGQ